MDNNMENLIFKHYFENANILIGISKSKEWVRVANDKIFTLSKENDYLHFLPCLEIDIDYFRKTLLNDFNLEFPFAGLVNYALKSWSEHWQQCAIEWVPKMLDNKGIQEGLYFASKEGKTQKIRQNAKKYHDKILLIEKI
jgi:hypothetical protein